MYAIKPWGKVFFVGTTISSYAMGIGMRWRESDVNIVEKRSSPSYERQEVARCVLSDQTVKLLVDLGCTEAKLRATLRLAVGWRFMNLGLEVMRESSTFPGCAEGETAFHCSKGALLQFLRTEFLRFGGTVTWGAEAYDAFASNDGTNTWRLRKEYGPGSAAEAIITTASQTNLCSMLIAEDSDRVAVMFDVETGVSPIDSQVRERFFGTSTDVAILVGRGLAMHLWLMENAVCSWRLVRTAVEKVGDAADALQTLDAVVRGLILTSRNRRHHTCVLPVTTPAIRDDAGYVKASVLGDGLLPVDPFEWRGDNARCAIEEASSICRSFYEKKYHRGDVPFLLRSAEQDSLSKRANLLKRDLIDAEHFLAIHPALDDEPAEPIGCIGVN